MIGVRHISLCQLLGCATMSLSKAPFISSSIIGRGLLISYSYCPTIIQPTLFEPPLFSKAPELRRIIGLILPLSFHCPLSFKFVGFLD